MERVVVIGGGGAGTAAATITKRLNPELKVSVFTEFSDIAYSPCGIPFVHGREIPSFDDLFLSTVERYREDGLDMRMETVVTDIDLDRRTITTKNEPEGFDQLILCTGFFWEQPDVPGREPRRHPLRQGHPQVDGVRQEARLDEADLRRRRRDRSASRWPAASRIAGCRSISSTRARGCCTRSSTPTSPSPCTTRSRRAA